MPSFIENNKNDYEKDIFKGVKVWIPHVEQGWISGTVIKIENFNKIIIKIDDLEDQVFILLYIK